MQTAWDTWDIVALVNFEEQPREKRVALRELGIDDRTECLAWSFWEERIVDLNDRALVQVIEPVSAQVYSIRRLPGRPVILATDMHLTQGAVELDEVKYDAEKGILSGNVLRAPGSEGRLFLFSPPDHEPDPNLTLKAGIDRGFVYELGVRSANRVERLNTCFRTVRKSR